MQRIFLLTNDDDFVPFCQAIRDFGVNISIVHLFDTGTPNLSLLKAADTYDTVSQPSLAELFVAPEPTEAEGPGGPAKEGEPAKEKETEAPATDALLDESEPAVEPNKGSEPDTPDDPASAV